MLYYCDEASARRLVKDISDSMTWNSEYQLDFFLLHLRLVV